MRFLKKATMAATGKRGMNYGPLLLLALVAAFLSVLMLHKLRERRVLGLMVQEQQQQLLTLQLHLQKEKEQSREMRSRLEELRGKTISLVNQKTELNSKLMETKTILSNLEIKQKQMESALEEKEIQINGVTEKAAGLPDVDHQNHQVTTLIQLLNQKEAEMDEMKRRLRLIDDNPAEKSTVRNRKEKKYDKSQDDGSQEMSTHHGNGEPSEEREVRDADEATTEHEKPSKARNWVQIEEQGDEEEDDDEVEAEKLDFPNKTQPEEEQITETKERKDTGNVEPTTGGATADKKTARREEEETHANKNGETEKPHDSLRKTARREGEEAQANKDGESEKPHNHPSRIDDANLTEETDGPKMKFRQGEITERSSRSKFFQESERDQDHKMDSEEAKYVKDAELISHGDDDDVQILKSKEGKTSETSSRSRLHLESGKDEQRKKMDSEEEKDVKNVELLSSRTDDSQNTKLEANEVQIIKDAESEKPHHYPPLDDKVSADAKFSERSNRALRKSRPARRIKRRSSKRQHLLKTETSQGDESQMNRRNSISVKTEIDNNKIGRNRTQTTADGGRSRTGNKEIRDSHKSKNHHATKEGHRVYTATN